MYMVEAYLGMAKDVLRTNILFTPASSGDRSSASSSFGSIRWKLTQGHFTLELQDPWLVIYKLCDENFEWMKHLYDILHDNKHITFHGPTVYCVGPSKRGHGSNAKLEAMASNSIAIGSLKYCIAMMCPKLSTILEFQLNYVCCPTTCSTFTFR